MREGSSLRDGAREKACVRTHTHTVEYLLSVLFCTGRFTVLGFFGNILDKVPQENSINRKRKEHF